MAKTKKNLVRISELVKRSGVSAPTIKHYINEGLLPQPIKPSKNMAYYEESCIERIKLIKKIQKEKFLPLDMIKRVIDSGDSYAQHLEMGEAIIKSHKVPLQAKKVIESKIERHSGYPVEKINILENEGLIHPEISNHGKIYDDSDCQIIAMMKQREEIGARFDYSVETLRIYRDAIKEAVSKDISLFARNMIGDISAEKAIKLLTEADETLDNFMVIYRYKMLRKMGEEAIKEVNDLANSLKILVFFPIEGLELPKQPPKNMMERCFYYLCKGDYKAIQKTLGNRKRKDADYDQVNFSILADILDGNLKEARKKVTTHMPKPSSYALNNAIAALTYLFSINDEGGFSVPMFNAKKMLAYLKRIEKSNERYVFSKYLALFICGAIYVLLPNAVNQHQEGVEILSRLSWPDTRKKLEEKTIPEWLIRTLEHEVFPAIEIRINRFLAEGYRKLGQNDKALVQLNEILAVSDPEGEMAEWAGMQRLLITK
ncbi:MerR family transcriptional regulator [bacterium]|nr:MerR family transcriptional regulator [bacterium]